MRPIILLATLAVAATPAFAGPKDHGNGQGHGKMKAHQSARAGCPPGLAKKSPACVPPGLAKKQDHDRDVRHHYRVGDRIDYDNVILIQDPGHYGLDPYGTYYRAGDRVIRVDRETSEVIALIGLARAILGG